MADSDYMTKSDPMLMVISAPSGAGKTTLAQALLKRYEDLRVCVSHTTRPPRVGEVDGEDYCFVTPADFDTMVAEGAFLEWAHVHDQRYGTSHQELSKLTSQGLSVLFDVDYQGGISIMEAHPSAVSVFILPPSLEELARRIRARGTDSAETIARRLHNATHEIKQYQRYQYVIINNDLNTAVLTIESIYRAEKQRTDRMEPRVRPMVSGDNSSA